jgi:3-oxoacyl-[acyl-carrier-protein] synthase II
MRFTSRRAVITGVGVVSPIGSDLASFWESLRLGRSGIKPIRSFDTSGLPVHFGGEVPHFEPKNYVEKKQAKGLKVMARTIQMAVAGAKLALDNARVSAAQLDPARFGVEFGASLISSELVDFGLAARLSANCQPGVVDLEKWGEEGLAAMTPLWMLKYLPNMLACHVSILHNAQGPNNTITQTDVGGLLALGEACRIIHRDQADFFLVGGADSKISPLGLVRQTLFQPLSRRNDSPEAACRPFDRDRDGLVIGEGAGVFALEELEHARRRGARIYAEVAGFGASFDRDRTGKGLAVAIRAALADAGIGPEDIDHVNAQGLSTVEADRWEARGIQEVFGRCSPAVPVFAAKSYFGNLGAASGPAELAASLLALDQGQLPATLNYEHPDPGCPVTVLPRQQPVSRSHVLKISFTEMGQCAAVVCRKWQESGNQSIR